MCVQLHDQFAHFFSARLLQAEIKQILMDENNVRANAEILTSKMQQWQEENQNDLKHLNQVASPLLERRKSRRYEDSSGAESSAKEESEEEAPEELRRKPRRASSFLSEKSQPKTSEKPSRGQDSDARRASKDKRSKDKSADDNLFNVRLKWVYLEAALCVSVGKNNS